MSQAESITFLTTPDRSLPYGLADHPYQRVLKILTSDGVERSSPALADYDAGDLDEVEFESKNGLSQRLVGFFDTYLVRGRQPEIYNCHRFALAMSGVVLPDGYEHSDLTEITTKVVARSRIQTNPLALGQMGSIGLKERHVPRALHSVIGLGTDSQYCLQVMGINGNLALDTYENVLELCKPDNGHPYTSFGLYAPSYIRRLCQRILG